MAPLSDKYTLLQNLIRTNGRSWRVSVLWIVVVILGRSRLGLDGWGLFSALLLSPLLLQYITAVCLYRYVVRKTAYTDNVTNDELVVIRRVRNSAVVDTLRIILILVAAMLWSLCFEQVPVSVISFLLLIEVLIYVLFISPVHMDDPKGI